MKKYRDLISFFTDLYSDPINSKVEDPHQTPAPAPPTLGHASFRPYPWPAPEPLLQPKNGTDGPVYTVFEKSFSPMDKKITFPNQNGEEEEQRIITPSKSSTENLFEPPPSDLVELLPEGAHKEDYLPAIRLAIRFTAWKQSLQEKARRAWARWKQRHQKTESFGSFGKGGDAFSGYESLGNLFNHQGLGSFEDAATFDEFETPFDVSDWNEKATKLKSAYNALQGVIYDYQRYGLLHYRPLADVNRSWAVTQNQGVERGGSSEAFQTIKKVIASWAVVYDIFTHPRIRDDIPGWLEHSWEGDTLRRYADLHRQMQCLPSCLLFSTPIFPDSKDSNKDTYFDKIVRVVTKTADYLNNSLEAALRKATVAGSHTDSQTLESFRSRITHILNNEGSYRHPPVTSPGPLFLIDDLRKMPEHLVKSLPHYGSNDDLITAAIDAYQNNLLQMEAIFSEVVNFPELNSQ